MTEDLATARQAFLLAAINDAEGTIRATDAKASIALVLHGLLFSGLLAVLGDVGDTYACASSGVRTAIATALALAACAFVLSVVQLLRCVRPAPARVIPALAHGKSRGTFFVLGKGSALWGNWKPDRLPATFQHELVALTSSAMASELAGELIKLSAIRGRKTALITSGIRWLTAMFGAVVVFLALLASQVI